MNNSLGLFRHLILRGAKLEEYQPRDKQWSVEGIQKLKLPPEASLAHRRRENGKQAFLRSHWDRKPAVCYYCPAYSLTMEKNKDNSDSNNGKLVIPQIFTVHLIFMGGKIEHFYCSS